MKTLWGVNEVAGNTPKDGGYTRLFKRIAAEGFAAIETPIWKIEDKEAFAAALSESGLKYVAMINTCTREWRRGGALTTHSTSVLTSTSAPGDHNGSHDIEHHIASFERQLAEAAAMKPLLVNAHSGMDAWSAAVGQEFFKRVLALEASYPGLLICHETHRGRILYNPWATRDMCRAFPELKLTADLSHFCVVAERVFAADDADWNACMAEFTRATRHIHARVGYAEGPQVGWSDRIWCHWGLSGCMLVRRSLAAGPRPPRARVCGRAGAPRGVSHSPLAESLVVFLHLAPYTLAGGGTPSCPRRQLEASAWSLSSPSMARTGTSTGCPSPRWRQRTSGPSTRGFASTRLRAWRRSRTGRASEPRVARASHASPGSAYSTSQRTRRTR